VRPLDWAKASDPNPITGARSAIPIAARIAFRFPLIIDSSPFMLALLRGVYADGLVILVAKSRCQCCDIPGSFQAAVTKIARLTIIYSGRLSRSSLGKFTVPRHNAAHRAADTAC
jgi:hypothetical protein